MVSKTKPNRASKASKVGHDEIVVALRGGVNLDTSNLNCQGSERGLSMNS